MITIVSTPDAPSSPLYSQGVRAGQLLFVSGMTGIDTATGQQAGPTIQQQTTQALRNALAVVEADGGTRADIAHVTVLLAHPEDFAGMNEAYGAFFPSRPPARAVTRLGPELPGVLVSVMMTAYRGD
ncbi:MAG: RidA family protein [Microbacteriaceae bacterium]